MRFIFEQLRVGGDRNFGYLLGDREAREALVVDPSLEPRVLLERAEAQGLNIVGILNTHGHEDHAHGNGWLAQATGAPVLGGPRHPGRLDRVLREGDAVGFGAFRLKVWQVPGHCPDHLAFRVKDWGIGLTGDHLFVGKVGGTATPEAGRQQWESLQRLLRDWDDATTLWPGHDYGARPSSTIALERATNPFLLAAEVTAFLDLKARWTAFKAEQGLR